MLKKLFDLTFSIFLTLVLLPIFLVISFLIKTSSSGPIFFVQQRIGKDGVHFGMIKFRTMVVNAEKQGTGLDSYDDDPRVTIIGRILRNSSLDEIPQLFNIIMGQMSFVGPRPPTTYHPYKYKDYPRDKINRFSVKPGVTGWAQINGRNNLSWDEKIAFDLEYIVKVSFLFDMKIILFTILKVISNDGGYDEKK